MDLCMISGEQEILAPMVPKGIVNMQANAKLISSNDTANFVFRGRFTDAEQASSVGYSTFQKVFVILQWLANNSETSFCVSDRTFCVGILKENLYQSLIRVYLAIKRKQFLFLRIIARNYIIPWQDLKMIYLMKRM